MSPGRFTVLALLAASLWPQLGSAADSAAVTPSAPSAPSADRIVISANGSTLTGASGGGGGSLEWLHNFSDGLLGVAGEYQTLANAHWAFGSLSGSLSGGSTDDKWTAYADVHLGEGDIGSYYGLQRFDYDVEGAGVAGTFDSKFTVQVEGRQYDVDTSHGDLPKIAVGYLWTPHWQTTVSYARSVSGNLGTELETLRIDHYGRTVNWLIGGATGHVAPPIVNLYTGLTGPAPQYREGYLGIAKAFSRVDLSLLGDYLSVSGTRRITLTLVCTLHVARTAT